MTLGQSLWVGASDDLVLGSLDARLAQGAFWGKASADALSIRTGVVFAGDQNLLVARADLKVDVKRLHFLSTKGDTNGAYVGTNKSLETVTVPAAPALGARRIDVLWVTQRDKKAILSADPATFAEFGVTSGDAGSSPVKPAVPAGTTEVGTISWDSTSTVASATNAAQCTVATTCRWVVPTGVPVPVRDQVERDGLTAYAGLRVLRLDRGAAVETHDGARWSTDWVDLGKASGVSGTLKYRPRGSECDIAIDVTGSFPAGFSAVSAAGALPAAVRPTITPARGVAYTGSGTAMGTVEILTNGTVNVQVPAGTAGVAKAQFPFPVG